MYGDRYCNLGRVWAALALVLALTSMDKFPKLLCSGHLPVADLAYTSGCLSRPDLAHLLFWHSQTATVAFPNRPTNLPVLTVEYYSPALLDSSPDPALTWFRGCKELAHSDTPPKSSSMPRDAAVMSNPVHHSHSSFCTRHSPAQVIS